MPLPVFIGLPWLAAIIGGLFAAIFSFAVKFFTKRLAIAVAVVALIVGLTASLWLALEALLVVLTPAIPAPMASMGAMFMPANASLCMSIIISAKLLKWAYDWNVKIIQYKLF